ncbi:hypothetical protein N7474_003269 [Penicillium riverlandense]|uniref:uncharacterized protein n=1 Tax=Penicillium riverlandense TaxID=1903569 RepID=UPI002548C6D4|nr:uncharacterized protein N7474_003269 [Penicillium riverlandense]KAJ5826131.1 hypothetical protein N7474_003269 [Penicillium riverlandense]
MFESHILRRMRHVWDSARKEQQQHSNIPSSTKPESSRLLEEDPYQAGYGYGAFNTAQHANQPDPESVRREREALEAICQRTSDSVIDIWSLQPQPHLQPRATLHGPTSTSASPTPDDDNATLTVSADRTSQTSRPTSGTGGAVPKHWGEVVVNPTKKRSRPDMKIDGNGGAKRDVFGVLQVN